MSVWRSKRACTRNELESFVGHLAHASIVIRHGGSFCAHCSLYCRLQQDLNFSFALINRFALTCNGGIASSKIGTVHCFLQDWNGSSFFPPPTPSVHVFSDASGVFGCGAFDTQRGWFKFQWRSEWADRSIAVKEMVPVVVAAALWGRAWEGRRVCFHSDNLAVVMVLTKRSAKDRHLLALLRCLFFLASFHKFQYSAVHVPGVYNTAADALSRSSITDFSPFVPQIPACRVPQTTMELLVHQSSLAHV